MWIPQSVWPALRSTVTVVCFIAALVAIAGCGGSDDSPPMASAGPDRTIRVGESLQLDGSASHGSQFNWALTRKPQTSGADLDCKTAPVATLVADTPGRYEVELDVDGTKDSAVVQVQPAYTLTPINTRVISGGGSAAADYAMQIGTQMLAAPALPDGTANGIHVVAVDRSTQEVVANLSYPISTSADIDAIVNDINNSWAMNSENLVLISGMNLAQLPSTSFVQVVTNIFGGGADIALTGAFSVVGVRGMVPFEGDESVRNSQPLRGSLTLDTTGHYSFVHGDFVEFDTRAESSATANTISVGSTQFPATLPAGATGGFQVVVVPRDGTASTVAPSPCPSGAVCPQQAVFGTNAATEAESEQAMVDMHNLLLDVLGDEAMLALIASIGDPLPQASVGSNALTQLQTAISLLGGNRFVLDQMARHVIPGTQNYGFVGGAPPPPITGLPKVLATEASSVTTSCAPNQTNCAAFQSARLRGELAKTRRNLFEPRNASPLGNTELDLYAIAYQAPQPWPVSGTASAAGACGATPHLTAQSAVFVYLSQLLLGSDSLDADIRGQYTNVQFPALYSGCFSLGTNPTSCSVPAIPAGGPKFPGSRTFERRFGTRVGEREFKEVVEQLNMEFTDVVLVLGRFALITDLIDQANETAGDVIDTIAISTFRRPAPPPAPVRTSISWLHVVADCLSIVGAITGVAAPEAAAVFGVIYSALDLGADLSRTSIGIPSDYSRQVQVLATEQDWKEEAATNFAQLQSGVQTLAGLILSDWGKLQAVGDRLSQPTQYPGWVWTEGATGTSNLATQSFTVGMAREYYGQGLLACGEITHPSTSSSGLGAIYVPESQGALRNAAAITLFGSGTDQCTIYYEPQSMADLRVIEPVDTCTSFPCGLGLLPIDLYFRLFHTGAESACCGCGDMVDCPSCCTANSCIALSFPTLQC